MKQEMPTTKGSIQEEGPLAAFTKRRKQLLRASVESIVLTFVSLAIVGTQLFYPFHMVIGLTLYALSFIPLGRRIYLGRKTWQTYHAYAYTADFFKRERRRLVLAVCVVLASIVFLYVRPLDARPFADMTHADIATRVVDDLYTSVTAMDYLESTGNTLLAELTASEQDVKTNEQVTHAFEDFLQAVAFSESLTDTHRYFASIPYTLWDERVTSFLISYSLYVKKYELVHRIMVLVSDDAYKKKILNQYMFVAGRDALYDEMVVRFFAPKTRLRLSGGYYYLRLFAHGADNPTEAYTLLHDKAVGSYAYLRSNILTTITHSGEVFSDATERQMFDTWFPIQKSVATGMGRAILTTRGKDGFITPEQAMAMQEKMLPGDIMFQRRNWHVSNVGIPGFWTHAALYTGDLQTMDEYFASEYPRDGYETLSALLKERYPQAYERFQMPDKDGQPRAVVEAIEAGVVMQSLPVSADADFVVVLRPTLSKKDALLAVMKAFENVGKPYDFNFDFDTRDALVCSELVYDAYAPRLPEKEGLTFATSTVNGRTIVAPMDMVRRYQEERGTLEAQLTFIYFLRGSEETQTARVSDEQEFIESIYWNKFSFFQPS